MEESRFLVPTYYGAQNELLADRRFERLEYSDPLVPILVREEAGLRLILGRQNVREDSASDILVERRPYGWAIFLHPFGGDASGAVYILDDGRTFVVPEVGIGPTPPIQTLHCDAELSELDAAEAMADQEPGRPAEPEDSKETCQLCRGQMQYSGDNWDTLCARCADVVSLYLDRFGLSDDDRGAVTEYLKAGPRGAMAGQCDDE